MARQQVNVRLSSYTVGQLKDLANRFDMSESTVIMLAIDRLVRDVEVGRGVLGESEEKQERGGQEDGRGKDSKGKAPRSGRGHDPQAP